MGLGTYPKMSPQLHILTGSPTPSYYLMSMLQGDVDVIIII